MDIKTIYNTNQYGELWAIQLNHNRFDLLIPVNEKQKDPTIMLIKDFYAQDGGDEIWLPKNWSW